MIQLMNGLREGNVEHGSKVRDSIATLIVYDLSERYHRTAEKF